MDTLARKIEFNDYKIFDQEEKKFVFSTKDNKIFEVDDRTIQLLNENGKNYEEIYDNLHDLFSKDEFDKIINDMTEHGFIKNPDEKTEIIDAMKIPGDLRVITLLVVQECNLRCSYCYGEDGNYNDCGVMDIKVAKRAVDFLIEKTQSERLTICFFGGEPLIKFDLIKEVVSYCRQRETETGKKFGFTMTSNGTLINKEIEEYIIHNKIKLQISIDGDKEVHDFNRYYADKSGSHDLIVKQTEFLRKTGLLDARATVTGIGKDLIHTNEYLKSLGFNKIALSPAFNLLTDKEYDILADSYIQLYLKFENHIKAKEYHEVTKNKLFMQELNKINNSRERKIACGVGRNLYAVDINGNIYPCQRFVNNKDFSLGNIFEGDSGKEEFLNKVTISNYEKCSDCWAKNLCVSGCCHCNLTATGDINSPYEPYCNYVKKINTALINIYLRLTDKEHKVIFGVQK